MLPSCGVQSLVGGEEIAQHFSKASLRSPASTPSGGAVAVSLRGAGKASSRFASAGLRDSC